MKATGIVRRIDDLGRIVIPKEIRRALRIREGDPLELFTSEGAVTFRRYQPYSDSEWTKAKEILSAVLDRFAILDRYGDFAAGLQLKDVNLEAFQTRDDVATYEVKDCGETIAHLVVSHDCDFVIVQTAVKILQKYLKQED